jgi:hypothetical protein
MFQRHGYVRAVAASVLPLLAMAVLGYLMYSAGIEPADPKDKYQAWYIGAAVLASSLFVVFGKRWSSGDMQIAQVSQEARASASREL